MPARSLALAAFAAVLAAPAALAGTAPAPGTAYRVTARIPAGDGGWDFASLDPVHDRLYVARADRVTAIDIAGGAVIDRLAPARRAHAVTLLDSGKTLLETDGETGKARFIATADGRVLGEIATGGKPDAAVADPVTGRIAVMNAGDGSVAVIDPASRQVTATVPVAGGLEFAVADGHGGVFINLEDAGAIAHVDLRSGKLLGQYPLAGCEGPTGLALTAGRLISACANGVAAISDPTAGKTVATLPIGRDPDAVLLDEARGLAFVPCGGSGTLVALAIADPRHIRVAAVIPTEVGARTGAVDPRDGRIYLPTARFSAPAPGAKRGKAIPGTFAVLVVSPGA